MLNEIHVSQLGVIDDLSVVLGPGMTALTGETGAGKTLVVEAVELLLGGRADATLVRPGATEAVAEGRFVSGRDGTEVVMSRVVPADGRSRAYLNGRMATIGALAEAGERLVDLHGQHAHQSLLSSSAQREALDSFAGADRSARDAARSRLRLANEAMANARAHPGERARMVDLLEYQIAELGEAAPQGVDEEDRLTEEEDGLCKAAAHRAAAESAYEALSGEDQILDRLGVVVSGLSGHTPLAPLYERLRGLAAELTDAAAEARASAERLEEDPQRLAEVVARRAVLRDLRRKYGRHGAGLEAVFAFEAEARHQLAQLRAQEGMAARLAEEHAAVLAELVRESEKLGAARRGAAASLGAAVEAELRRLAMPRARFEVNVGGDDLCVPGAEQDERGLRSLSGEDVAFLLAANPGEPVLPLTKVASGGELARAMLALRLVLLQGGALSGRRPQGGDVANEGPGTLVFDEVDAGIGGEAAVAVGRALAELAQRYQVIVVTHLAQVAAFAAAQVAVTKVERDGRSVALARVVEGQERVVELSRMLSGQPDSRSARLHAEELLMAAVTKDLNEVPKA